MFILFSLYSMYPSVKDPADVISSMVRNVVSPIAPRDIFIIIFLVVFYAVAFCFPSLLFGCTFHVMSDIKAWIIREKERGRERIGCPVCYIIVTLRYDEGGME